MDLCPRCAFVPSGAGSTCSRCGLFLDRLLGAAEWRGELSHQADWDGIDKEDLLIIAPDSSGDTFERSRHLNVLTERGVNWHLVADANIIPLLKEMFPKGRFTPFGSELPKFRSWTWLMEGLKGFSPGRPEPATIVVPEHWKKDFSVTSPSVGVCFRAAERYDWVKFRFIEDRGVEQITQLPNIDWISLQYGEQKPPGNMRIPPFGPWHQTAGLIAKLDAVISADTAIAHLCAILRKPCIVIHGTAHTSVTEYADYNNLYPNSPFKQFVPTYGGFEGGRPAWKKFIEWANKTPEWWKRV